MKRSLIVATSLRKHDELVKLVGRQAHLLVGPNHVSRQIQMMKPSVPQSHALLVCGLSDVSKNQTLCGGGPFVFGSVRLHHNQTSTPPQVPSLSFSTVANHNQQQCPDLKHQTDQFLSSLESRQDSILTDDNVWRQAEELLRGWVRRCQNENDRRQSPSDERSGQPLISSFEILQVLSRRLPREDVLMTSFVPVDVINDLLYFWNLQLSKSGPSTTKQDNMPSPATMAKRMDAYMWCSLVQPNVRTYNLILHAAASHFRTSAEWCETLWEKLIEVSEQQHRYATISHASGTTLVDIVTATTVMKAWCREGYPEKAYAILQQCRQLSKENTAFQSLQPNTVAYSTLMRAFGRTGKDIDVVQEVFQQQLLDGQTHIAAKPDTQTLSVVLDAYAKSKTASTKLVSELLETMQQWNIIPDTYLWTNLIAFYASRNVRQAEKLWEDWKDLYKRAGDCPQPTVLALNAILHAHAQQGNGGEAERILRRALQQRHAFPVDAISFNTVITAHSKSHPAFGNDRLRKIHALVDDMKANGLEPDVATYASWIHAYALGAKEDPKAAEKATFVLRKIMSVEPNSVCIHSVLQAWSNVCLHHRDRTSVPNSLQLLKKYQHQIELKDNCYRTVLYTIATSAGVSYPTKYKLALEVVEWMKERNYELKSKDRKMLRRLHRRATERKTRAQE